MLMKGIVGREDGLCQEGLRWTRCCEPRRGDMSIEAGTNQDQAPEGRHVMQIR